MSRSPVITADCFTSMLKSLGTGPGAKRQSKKKNRNKRVNFRVWTNGITLTISLPFTDTIHSVFIHFSLVFTPEVENNKH